MPRTNKQPSFLPGKFSLLTTLLMLGFLEFSAAAILILRIAPDPKNAVLFGYSFARLSLFLLAIIPTVWLLMLAVSQDYRAWVLVTPLQKRLDKTHPDCTLLDWWIV